MKQLLDTRFTQQWQEDETYLLGESSANSMESSALEGAGEGQAITACEGVGGRV
jgi:hypothetical protein